ISRANQHLLDELRIEVEFVSSSLFRIIPSEQKSATLGAEMKAVGHVDYHRDFAGNLIEWLRRDQHATQRLHRKIDARHRSDLGGPRAGGIYHNRCMHLSACSCNSRGAAALIQNVCDLGRLPN